MEDCVEKLEVVPGRPKRSRSLDIHQLYEERVGEVPSRKSQSENGDDLKCKRPRTSRAGGDDDRNHKSDVVVGQSRRKIKSQENILLRSLRNSSKKCENSHNVSQSKANVVIGDRDNILIQNDDCTSDGSFKDPNRNVPYAHDGTHEKNVDKTVLSDNRQQHACLGDNLVIPKRPRGASRRKKFSHFVTLKEPLVDLSVPDSKKKINAPNSLSSGESISSAGKHKNIPVEHKESGSNGKRGFLVEIIPPNDKEQTSTCKEIQRKIVKNHRKRRYSTSGKHAHLSNEGIFNQKSKDSVDGARENEEENLEENAARMLSSRFDPNCTGFSGNRTSPEQANGFPVNSHSFSLDSNTLGSKDSSLDDANRVLRPRRRNDKNSVRKRRHFYEVCAGDMDPFWVLNKRIKIFWPLDQNWYIGLVREYNPVTGLHHVKYDDREEEWINLQNERFKLLMFPSEFSDKLDYRKGDVDVKQKAKGDIVNTYDDNTSNFTETEPIISWLARSTHRVKPSPLNILKERKKSHVNKHSSSSSLVDIKENMAACSLGANSNGLSSDMASQSVVDLVHHELAPKSRGNIMDRRYSNFYSRRRFHKGRWKAFGRLCKDSTSGMNVIDSSKVQGAFKFDVTLNIVKLNQEVSEIRFSLSKAAFIPPSESSRPLSLFWWLHFGTVILLWPMIHMDIFFLDDMKGLKIITYKGYLRHAVILLCLILRIFGHSVCCREPTPMQFPFTSIGFRFSGLQVLGKRLHFLVHYFLKLNSSKWEFLHGILKKQCIIKREIPFPLCTYSGTKNLLERSDLIPFVENTESTFLLGHHLKSLLKNDISSNVFENQSEMSTLDPRENHDKLTDDSCFPATDSSCLDDISSPDKSENGNRSSVNTLHYQKQVFQGGNQLLDDENKVASTPDLAWKVSNSTLHALDPASFQSKGKHKIHNRHTPVSPSFGYRSQPWPEDFLGGGFINGHRKPRTRVSYSSPFGGYHFVTETQNHRPKGHPYKKVRTDAKKKVSTVYGNSQTSLVSFVCEANVLVTEGDRGWREDAAQVVLESDQHDWKILVKLSGVTKFSYKAHQFLQPGTTNRYTHAMMWKGGKNWTLEFTDRSQWVLFKEMHEECYNRNVRAASVKNIPVPGVHLIEDCDCTTDIPPARSFPMYFRQVGTEVDIAMDHSRVIYDMESDDEEWLSKQCSLQGDHNEMAGITYDTFEKCIDMFEKIAYAQQCDEFSDAEIESFMVDIGPMNIIKLIHEYWRLKRKKKGVPLIQQFQPPLWEQYQKQLKEWEAAVDKCSSSSDATQMKKLMADKPPMFAFCLKPRGLEAPHKGFKQRSHKKFQHNIMTREHDTLHGFGRKPNGFPMVDDKSLVMVPNQDFHDSTLWLQSPTGFSPRDNLNIGTEAMTNDGFDRSHHLKLQGNTFKKAGGLSSHGDFHLSSSSYNQRMKRTGYLPWNSRSQEPTNSTKPIYYNGFYRHADIEEFRLRDASSAAQHATNMAKLKREKAQWLLHKADLALHRAVVALMTAEAIKASEKDLTDEEDDLE